MYGPSPQLDIMALNPIDENVVLPRSQGVNPPLGDRLYRSTDGGVTFTEVLVTIDPIFDVVVHDATAVVVATAQSGSFRSTDGGATFQPLAIQLAAAKRSGRRGATEALTKAHGIAGPNCELGDAQSRCALAQDISLTAKADTSTS